METYVLILGLSAAFMTTFAFVPQAIKTIRTKHTKDLSLSTLVMIEIGLVLWLCYGLFILSVPIILANTVSLVLISVILFLKKKYG